MGEGTCSWWLQLDSKLRKKHMDGGEDEWGLGPGSSHGLGDDGALDQCYELVLGMRLCAQCWEYRGEHQSGDVCMVGRTWKHTDIFSVQQDSKSCIRRISVLYGRGSEGLAGRQESPPNFPGAVVTSIQSPDLWCHLLYSPS